MRGAAWAVSIAGGGLFSLPCLAYPTALTAVPTGEAKSFGVASAYGYLSTGLAPQAASGTSSLGIEIGVLRSIPLEVGLDLLNADLAGTPDAYVKPELNAKLQLLRGSEWSPSVAVGIMGVDPFRPDRSVNVFYASSTLALTAHGTALGRLTLGLGATAAQLSSSGDPYRETLPVYRGSWPFGVSSRFLALAGYELPAIGPVSLSVDYFGGAGELGSTNLAAGVSVLPGLSWALGAWIGNDAASYSSGAFTYLYYEFALLK